MNREKNTAASYCNAGRYQTEFPMHQQVSRKRKKWDNQAVKGLTYLVTNKGPYSVVVSHK